MPSNPPTSTNYRIVLVGKCPWALAAQAQKFGGGPLHGDAPQTKLPNPPALSEN